LPCNRGPADRAALSFWANRHDPRGRAPSFIRVGAPALPPTTAGLGQYPCRRQPRPLATGSLSSSSRRLPVQNPAVVNMLGDGLRRTLLDPATAPKHEAYCSASPVGAWPDLAGIGHAARPSPGVFHDKFPQPGWFPRPCITIQAGTSRVAPGYDWTQPDIFARPARALERGNCFDVFS